MEAQDNRNAAHWMEIARYYQNVELTLQNNLPSRVLKKTPLPAYNLSSPAQPKRKQKTNPYMPTMPRSKQRTAPKQTCTDAQRR
uniref:Uncharacterized protein n=1 Tax=Arundo donax TaxID=35708 RepID=A0A0A9GK86_ARUDO